MTRTQQQRMKRRRQRRQSLFLAVVCALVLGLVFAVFSLTSGRYPGEGGGESLAAETAGVTAEAPAVSLQEAERPEDLSLTLGLGGDVAFEAGRSAAFQTAGIASPWEGIRSFLERHDLNVVSLESPLCRGGSPNPDQPSLCLRGDISGAASMAAAGVSAVCMANDHVMDYGARGLEETLNLLRGEKVGACGAGSDRRAAGQPVMLKAPGGAGVALLSFNDVGPGSYAAGEDSPGVNAVTTLEELGNAVSAAAAAAPYVVVYVHWGEANKKEISSRQREIACVCARAGADLVVGCHPHFMQGVEVVEGTPVIYSLGGLVYGTGSGAEGGLLASCRFEDGYLRSVDLYPVRCGERGAVLLADEEADEVLAGLVASSPGTGLRVSPGGSVRLEPR
ncbi:MAG: CapA family protein [Actinomycetota bacterium]|nr:CapA family protein [Actinomycetota bacterium]